ncbi:hypothetical protein P692DRAFT_20881779 [Suillus brevipes Sb2]|nr:hypothetical protein P692DRAFT_20881779 [Suillus brevipes Sb2]
MDLTIILPPHSQPSGSTVCTVEPMVPLVDNDLLPGHNCQRSTFITPRLDVRDDLSPVPHCAPPFAEITWAGTAPVDEALTTIRAPTRCRACRQAAQRWTAPSNVIMDTTTQSITLAHSALQTLRNGGVQHRIKESSSLWHTGRALAIVEAFEYSNHYPKRSC